MKRPIFLTTLAASALVLAGCSGGVAADDPDTLTIAGWGEQTTPEFQILAEGFAAAHPDVDVEVKYYDASQYDTLLTADLAAKTAPNVIAFKTVMGMADVAQGGQLVDVSDLDLPAEATGVASYTIDGKTWASPYRQDEWLLFYNKDLFDEAGVGYPDGSWTWDDYARVGTELRDGLKAAGSDARAAFQLTWQDPIQAVANAQQDADIIAGDFDYMAPYYERSIALEKEGVQETYNTVSANQLTYQGEFGTQNAAMMLMGSWYVGALMLQQAGGEAQDFPWGIAPLPQTDGSTTGTDAVPVTFGDPTGFGINAHTSDEKQALAREFLEYAASEEAGTALAEAGIMPAVTNEAVVEAVLSADAAPQDDLSRFAIQTHDIRPQTPTSPDTSAVQNILMDMHTAIMSGAQGIDEAIAEAEQRVADEVTSK